MPSPFTWVMGSIFSPFFGNLALLAAFPFPTSLISPLYWTILLAPTPRMPRHLLLCRTSWPDFSKGLSTRAFSTSHLCSHCHPLPQAWPVPSTTHLCLYLSRYQQSSYHQAQDNFSSHIVLDIVAPSPSLKHSSPGFLRLLFVWLSSNPTCPPSDFVARSPTPHHLLTLSSPDLLPGPFISWHHLQGGSRDIPPLA